MSQEKCGFELALARTKTEQWTKAAFQARISIKIMLKYLTIFHFANHFWSPSCKSQTCRDVNHVSTACRKGRKGNANTRENGVKYFWAKSRTTMVEVAWLTSQFAHMCCSVIVRESPTLSLLLLLDFQRHLLTNYISCENLHETVSSPNENRFHKYWFYSKLKWLSLASMFVESRVSPNFN